jgi:hypothetical protein
MAGPVCIKVYNFRHEAERAVEILKSHRIWSTIQADDAGGMRPDFVMHTGGVKLLVVSEDEDKAREILDSFEQEESD